MTASRKLFYYLYTDLDDSLTSDLYALWTRTCTEKVTSYYSPDETTYTPCLDSTKTTITGQKCSSATDSKIANTPYYKNTW